jgi:serine protease AprX
MKKNTVKLFVIALALGGSLIATAQEKKQGSRAFQTNEVALKQLSEKYTAKYEAELAEATRLAEINNWPLEVRTKEGGYKLLTRVDENGKPLYTETFNVGSALTTRVNELQEGGSSGLNLTGLFSDGVPMQVGIWDGEYPLFSHVEFALRIETIDGGVSPHALHPTHVFGTMVAAGLNSAARGMAYKATGKAANFANDFAEMASNAASIIVSNHSYGIPQAPKGAYQDYAQQVDQVTFFAPYYQPIIAAGNDGNGSSYNRMGDRGISKNAITVAAIYELDHVTTTEAVIADFSSFGPTNDNRIKPDISSKGVAVFSTIDTSNNAYGDDQGTSMACPGVTGALALIQQYYAELHTPASTEPVQIDQKTFMLSSTLRALTAHCALEAGVVGPDPIFGWGVLDARKMADVITNEGETSLLLENTLLPGVPYTFDVVALGTEPLVATLAWTDPAPTLPGSGTDTTPQVNNLDIRITKNTTTFFPWKLAFSPSAAPIKGDNNVDNIEKVEVANPSGSYTITISHKGTTLVNPEDPSFPLPTTPQQVYSLVVTGINATGDAKDFAKDGFSVWPNPAKGYLNISMASELENGAKATIYDVQGRIVLQSAISAMDTELNIGNLSSGMYMVNITNGNKSEVKKFIVK